MAKVFDAAPQSTPTGGGQGEANAERARVTLRNLWARLTNEQARELFDVCVLGRWPEWVTLRAFGRPIPRLQERRRLVLEDGLDIVGRDLFRSKQGRAA